MGPWITVVLNNNSYPNKSHKEKADLLGGEL